MRTQQIYADRLLAAAMACNGHPVDMEHFGVRRNGCQTPGCVIGHYVAYVPSSPFKLMSTGRLGTIENAVLFPVLKDDPDNNLLGWDDPIIRRHFGITRDEGKQLFSSSGCGRAKTGPEVQAYITEFLQLHGWDVRKNIDGMLFATRRKK